MAARFTLVSVATARQEIRKSRFVSTAGPVADEAAAKEFIAARSGKPEMGRAGAPVTP